MALVGCFVTPHPPIIVPEVGGGQLSQVAPTVNAMNAASARVAALSPDTIVLLSPHAPIDYRRMGVSLAAEYKGSLAFFRAPQVMVHMRGDVDLARSILERSVAEGVPAALLESRDEVKDLDHGAMVPLVYITKSLPQACSLVLLAFSLLGLEDHVRFGRAIGEAILDVPQRVVYVASGDLSHRLIPGAPAGYDPRGERFDRAVADRFAAGDWQGLLSLDPDLVEAAGECGYRSLAVLAGVVEVAEEAGLRTRNHVLSYEGPFGVGYLVGEVEVMGESLGGEARSE